MKMIILSIVAFLLGMCLGAIVRGLDPKGREEALDMAAIVLVVVFIVTLVVFTS